MNQGGHHAGHRHVAKELNVVFWTIELYALAYQNLMVIHKPDANQNVWSIRIVQVKKRVSITNVRIHAKLQLVVLMLNVVFMITRPIVIVATDLWVMLSFIAYQFHRFEIQRPIHACHHHVCQEVYVKYTEMLLFAIHAQMKTVTIIPAVDQSAYRTVIVSLAELVWINVV